MATLSADVEQQTGVRKLHQHGVLYLKHRDLQNAKLKMPTKAQQRDQRAVLGSWRPSVWWGKSW